MKALTFGLILASSAILATGPAAAEEKSGMGNPNEAPLPALGLSLLGQLGAGVLGWSIYRSKRPS
jgi:hypothetical protein